MSGELKDPVIQFAPNEVVPIWIERVEPAVFQPCLRFIEHVDVVLKANLVVLKPTSPEYIDGNPLMAFDPGVGGRGVAFQINGAPTHFELRKS